MKNQQSGFTLIELIAVIVILGILAATAIPRFVDLSAAAEEAAVAGVAGSISSAASLNYANELARSQGFTISGTVTSVQDCATATVAALLSDGLPDGYTSTANGTLPAPAGDGSALTCTLTSSGTSVNYTIISADPAT